LSAEAVVRRVEQCFRGADGRALFRRAWLPPAVGRVVVLVHGFGEHSGRYEHLGAWLARRGFAVHAYDHRGHGLSQGKRGHVDRFDDLLDDLDRFLETVAGEHEGSTPILVGHSMGGLVAAAFVRERSPDLAGLVTSGAMLATSRDLPRWKVTLGRAFGGILPRLSLDAGIQPEWLSRDPEVVRAYREDPLVGRKMTAAMASGVLRAAERTAAGAGDVRLPALLLHGGDDRICPAAGTERFFEGLRLAGVPGCALRVYPGLRHEIFNEPEQERVFRDVLDWVAALEAEPKPSAP
jgi:acylglycerol lipase